MVGGGEWESMRDADSLPSVSYQLLIGVSRNRFAHKHEVTGILVVLIAARAFPAISSGHIANFPACQAAIPPLSDLNDSSRRTR
jgi:hypothetical protein